MEALAIGPAHLMLPKDHPLRELAVAVRQQNSPIEVGVLVRALLHVENFRRLGLVGVTMRNRNI